MSSKAWLSAADLTDGRTPEVAVGDLVRTGTNSHPVFQVIAVKGNRAWIRDIQHDADHVVPVDQCRKMAGR